MGRDLTMMHTHPKFFLLSLLFVVSVAKPKKYPYTWGRLDYYVQLESDVFKSKYGIPRDGTVGRVRERDWKSSTRHAGFFGSSSCSTNVELTWYNVKEKKIETKTIKSVRNTNMKLLSKEDPVEAKREYRRQIARFNEWEAFDNARNGYFWLIAGLGAIVV